MKTHVEEIPRWSTSSLGGAADPSPAELSTLTAQMDECKESRGRFFVLQCAVDTVSGFVVGHFVTTLILVALLIAIISLLL
jgi:hypothetical protein